MKPLVSSNLVVMLELLEFQVTEVVVHLRNLVVQLNLLLLILMRDNYYSPSLENVLQKVSLQQRLHLVILRYIQKHLILDLFLTGILLVDLNSILNLLTELLLITLVLDHLRNSVVLLNLLPLILLKSKCSSPSQVKVLKVDLLEKLVRVELSNLVELQLIS